MTIKINNLTKKYKDFTAVDNINLEIPSNTLLALLGVNGAGKSTTIKVLTGLEKKNQGKIYFDNLDLDKDIDKIKEISNISPQETAIAPNLTVKENLEFFASIYGLKGQELKQKTQELISMFDLQENANKKGKYLSGGTARRLSIAISLVSNPQILYLDEPTLGLDVLSRQKLWKIIKKLKNSMTIILTTHYIEEAESLADSIAIMDKGKIIQTGTPKELIEKTNSKNLEDAFVKIATGEEE